MVCAAASRHLWVQACQPLTQGTTSPSGTVDVTPSTMTVFLMQSACSTSVTRLNANMFESQAPGCWYWVHRWVASRLAVHFGILHFFFSPTSELGKATKCWIGTDAELVVQSEPAVRQPFTSWQKPLNIEGWRLGNFSKGRKQNLYANYVGVDTLCLDGFS